MSFLLHFLFFHSVSSLRIFSFFSHGHIYYSISYILIKIFFPYFSQSFHIHFKHSTHLGRHKSVINTLSITLKGELWSHPFWINFPLKIMIMVSELSLNHFIFHSLPNFFFNWIYFPAFQISRDIFTSYPPILFIIKSSLKGYKLHINQLPFLNT